MKTGTSLCVATCVLLVGGLGSVCPGASASEADTAAVATPGEGGYVSGALIYELEGRPTPQCHASTIVETPSGLVAAWFGGEREGHPSVGIWVSRHDAKRWSKPARVVDGSEGQEKDYPCWNPVLFRPKPGPLMLFYKVGPSPSRWWGMLVTSEDNGRSWSTPRKLGEDQALGAGNPNLLGPVKNKPIQLDDATILCPSSTEHQGWRVHFERTRDLGKTWEVIGPVDNASKFNAIQPSILTYPDGRMQILCRSRERVIVESWSTDRGKTWTPLTATDLSNPNSGIDAVTLADSRQLLVYNDVLGRGGLRVATSRDGKSWNPGPVLEREKGAEFSYPAVIQASDGRIHVTYTWKRLSVKHVVFDPAALR